MELLRQNRVTRPVICAVVAAVLVFTLAGGLFAAGGKETGDRDASTAVELKGLLIPLDQANISSRGTGVIREMKREGDSVRKDDVVVVLDNDVEKLSVKSAEAVLEVRQFEAEAANKLQKNGSESESNRRTADANLKTARIQLDQAKATLDKKTVYAPFDGVITRRMRNPGEATDNYLPLLTVVDLSKVYLETYLPANRLRDVQPGQEVGIRVPDLPGRKFTGKVDFIAPVIDPASGEFRMKVLVPNDDHALRSGMGAIGLLEINRSELSTDTAADARPTPAGKRAN